MKKLDLHGLRHEDARRAVISLVEGSWNTGIEVQIITGHSTRMREIVKDVFFEYGLDHKTSLDGTRIIACLE
jgi:DNA-nicking Smr family endonuclease